MTNPNPAPNPDPSTTPPGPSDPATDPTADPGAPGPDGAPEGAEVDPKDLAGARAEAAKRRVQLQEARGERDALAQRVAGYQTTEVEKLATAAGLASGPDLWATGTSLPDLLDDDGNVDTEAVSTRVGEVLAERPHWRVPAGPGSADQGSRGDGAPAPATTFSGFLSDTLQGRRG